MSRTLDILRKGCYSICKVNFTRQKALIIKRTIFFAEMCKASFTFFETQTFESSVYGSVSRCE